MKSCAIYLTKIAPSSPAIVPKIFRGQLLTVYSESSRFHPSQFTLVVVIAECVNTAKTCHKVNPIFS